MSWIGRQKRRDGASMGHSYSISRCFTLIQELESRWSAATSIVVLTEFRGGKSGRHVRPQHSLRRRRPTHFITLDLHSNHLPRITTVHSTSVLSERRAPTEEAAVDCVNNWLCADLPTAKESPVETLDCILAALHPVKLEVDVALSVGIEGNVHHMAIFIFALCADIVFELLDPRFAFLPTAKLGLELRGNCETYSVGSNIFRSKTHLLAWLTLTGSGFVSVLGLAIFCLWSTDSLGSSVLASFRINASRL
jgi:hypothetical protein